MEWYPSLVLWMAFFDAGLVLIGGLVTAFVHLVGWDAEKLWERVWPAALAIFVSTLCAALILGAAHLVVK